MRGITESCWCCRNCYAKAKSILEAGIHKLKMQMQSAMEKMKKSAEEAKVTSNEHQQTVTEMQFVQQEKNAINDTCNEVQKILTATDKKIASFAKTVKTLNKNMTFADVTKKNQVVIEQQNTKMNNPKLTETPSNSSSLWTPIQASWWTIGN